jgi:hypothetical protein
MGRQNSVGTVGKIQRTHAKTIPLHLRNQQLTFRVKTEIIFCSTKVNWKDLTPYLLDPFQIRHIT